MKKNNTLNLKPPYKVIIDTDPGVDDAFALILSMFDPMLDIKLYATVAGNIKTEIGTRNMLYLLDKFGVYDKPVARGAGRALTRLSKHAEFVHGEEGLGGHIPPKGRRSKNKVIDKSAVEAMYEIIKENPHEITLFIWGPHTNAAKLITEHPDVKELLAQIIFMGGSPYGVAGFPDHISFNIASDPEAFRIVVESGIPLAMVPSDMGRRKAHLTEKYVHVMRDENEVGAFIFEMFDEYWERNFPDKRIATNDTCAYIYLTHPELFKVQKANVFVDTKRTPGKTYAKFRKDGHVSVTVGVKRRKFLKLISQKMKFFDDFKLKN